jgi:glycosyltransferase involved in cell wall biosynthesis
MLLSACIIARNEGENLKRCLDSIASFVDEICLVDTGSTDDTRKIAIDFGARVILDTGATDDAGRLTDFSYARNRVIGMTTSKWALSIDADEVFHAQSTLALRDLLSRSRAHAFEVQIESRGAEWFLPRIFRVMPWSKYYGKVHEWVEIRGRIVRLPSVRICNFPNKAGKESAVERDLRLCTIELDENRKNIRAILYIARALRRKGLYEKAIHYYDSYWKQSTYEAGRYLASYETAICYLLLGDWFAARRYALRAYRLDNRLAEACCLLGDTYLSLGRPDLSRRWFWVALQKGQGPANYSLFIDKSCYETYPRSRLRDLDREQ